MRCLAAGRMAERNQVTMREAKLSLREIMKVKYRQFVANETQVDAIAVVGECQSIATALPPPSERPSLCSTSPRKVGSRKVRADACASKGSLSGDSRKNIADTTPDINNERGRSSSQYMEAASLSILMTKKISLMRLVTTIKCMTALKSFSDSRIQHRLDINKTILFWKSWVSRLEEKKYLQSIMVSVFFSEQLILSFERCQIVGSSLLKTAVRDCFDFNPFYSRELLSEPNYLCTGNKEESL